jgi:hypothetical protein
LVLGDQRAIAAADWTLFNAHRHFTSRQHFRTAHHDDRRPRGFRHWSAALWRRSPSLIVLAAAQSAGVMAGHG